jgi:hypothetical protein
MVVEIAFFRTGPARQMPRAAAFATRRNPKQAGPPTQQRPAVRGARDGSRNTFRHMEKKWRQRRATHCLVSGLRPRNRTACAVIAVPARAPLLTSPPDVGLRAAAASPLHGEAPAAIATSTSRHWFSSVIRRTPVRSDFLILAAPPCPVRASPRSKNLSPSAYMALLLVCRDELFSPECSDFSVRDC